MGHGARHSNDGPRESTGKSLRDACTADVLNSVGVELIMSDRLERGASPRIYDEIGSEDYTEIRKVTETEFLLLYGTDYLIGVDTTARSLIVEPSLDPEEPGLRHVLLDDAAPRLLSHHRRWSFHMGGVQMGTSAIAFIGPSGTGKSTLSAALVQSGARLLADDSLIIDPTTKTPSADLIYPSMRLWPDSLDGLPQISSFPAVEAGPEGKKSVGLNVESEARGGVALGAIYTLRRDEDVTEVSIERITPAAGAFSLVQCAFGLDETDLRWRKDLLVAAGRVSSLVPSYTLTMPSDFAGLSEVVSILSKRHFT